MSVKLQWIWKNSVLGLRKACLCTESLTSPGGFNKPPTATPPFLNSNFVSLSTQTLRACTHFFAAAFPMFVFIQLPKICSLTDTSGSTLSTTRITVQTSLSTSNKCTDSGPVIYKPTLVLVSVYVGPPHPTPTARRSPLTCEQRYATLRR